MLGRQKRWIVRGVSGLVLSLTLSGCQTYFGGMTLPSPHYLKHYPQFLATDPAFPLQRERDSMLDPEGAIRRGTGQAPIPGQPPVGGVPAPQPAGPGR